MPKTITDPDTGEEMEYYTKDEVEAQTQEAVKDKEFEFTEEKLKLTDQLTEAQKELEKEKEKEKNFNLARRRQAREEGKEVPDEEKSPEVKKLEKQVEDLSGKIDKVVTGPLEEVKADFVDSRIGVDQKARDLFDYYYKKTSTGAETKKQVETALKEAMVLYENAGGKTNPDSRMVRTGGGPSFSEDESGSRGPQSETGQRLAQVLEVSPADREKYGKGDVKMKLLPDKK